MCNGIGKKKHTRHKNNFQHSIHVLTSAGDSPIVAPLTTKFVLIRKITKWLAWVLWDYCLRTNFHDQQQIILIFNEIPPLNNNISMNNSYMHWFIDWLLLNRITAITATPWQLINTKLLQNVQSKKTVIREQRAYFNKTIIALIWGRHPSCQLLELFPLG